MDEPERHDLLAGRHVRLLHRDGKLPMPRHRLEAELQTLVPRPREVVRRIANAGVIQLIGGEGGIDAMICRAGPRIGEPSRVEYADVTVVVEEHGGDHHCTTIVEHGSGTAESSVYRLPLEREHFAALQRAVASIRASCRFIDVWQCSTDLGWALFDHPGTDEVVTGLLAAHERVRLRLWPRGHRLAAVPWELARRPGGRAPTLSDPRLSMVRGVRPASGAAPPQAAPDPRWLHFPRTEYVCLGTDSGIDQWAEIEYMTAVCGWPPARRLDPDGFLTAELSTTASGILHVVAHNSSVNGDLRLSGCRATRAGLVNAVLARRPALVYLGICHGTVERASGPSLARELCARGVPTVIALRGESAVPAQLIFLEEFYQRLSLTMSIDDAVSAGRAAVFDAVQALQFVHFGLDGPVSG